MSKIAISGTETSTARAYFMLADGYQSVRMTCSLAELRDLIAKLSDLEDELVNTIREDKSA